MSRKPKSLSENPEFEKLVLEEARRENRNFSSQVWYIVKKFFESKPKSK